MSGMSSQKYNATRAVGRMATQAKTIARKFTVSRLRRRALRYRPYPSKSRRTSKYWQRRPHFLICDILTWKMPDPQKTPQDDWDALAQQHDADLITYFGPVRSPSERGLLQQIEARKLRPNVILWLATLGGDPHTAYRVSRTLQRHYKTSTRSQERGTFTVFVDTICKSAGTIIVLGADRLVLSDYAELGPIDPQLQKPDDGEERTSSLTPMQALNALQTTSFELFKYYFSRLRSNSSWNLTTKTASEVAATMTIGLMEPIYSQIDPIRLWFYVSSSQA